MQGHRHFKRPNSTSRVFVFADVHGQIDCVLSLLASRDYQPEKDLVLFLGDMIDRGPDSLACLRLLNHPHVFSCLGNHEQLACQVFHNPNTDQKHFWNVNGGTWFEELTFLEQQEAINVIEKNMYCSIDFNWQGHKIGLVHADLPQNIHWQDMITSLDPNLINTMLWSRTRFKENIQQEVQGINAVIVGHNITQMVQRKGNVFYLDTGAAAIGRKHNTRYPRLSMLDFSESVTLHSIDATGSITQWPCELHDYLMGQLIS